MAIRFASGKYLRVLNASWVNDISSFSFACWVRITTLTTANKQYVWSHRGTGGQISLRKDSTTDKWRFSVTVNGSTFITVDSLAAAVAGTTYFISGDWTKNSSARLYVNGVLQNTTSTSSQTVNYDSGENSPFLVGVRTEVSDSLVGDVESMQLYLNKVLSAGEYADLMEIGWPGQCALEPDLWLECDGEYSLTDLPDSADPGHHAEVGVGPLTDPGNLALYRGAEAPAAYGVKLALAAGAAAPGPWVPFGSPVGATSVVVTGLTPGQPYEFVVDARDAAGNISALQSTPAEATPQGSIIRHRPKRVIWG